MSRLIKTWFFLMVCGGLLIVQPFPAHSNPLDPYIQAAKKEGSVTLGLTLRSKIHGKPSGELYIAAFQKKYPFLKVHFKRIGGPRERERIINEMIAGMFNYDVATMSETMIPTIVGAKLHRVVEWEKLGIFQFLIHPENYAISLKTPVYGIAYNRDLVPDEVAKTFTWETCIDPTWGGKSPVEVRPRHLERFYSDDVWGREKTLDYAKRWAASKPAVESSRSTAAAKLTAGVYHFICGMPRHQIKYLQIHGGAKNIDIVFPEPVLAGTGDLMYLPEKANHPNAAILFLAWSGTQGAQNLLDSVDFTGHPLVEGNDVTNILKGKKISYPTWESSARSHEVLAEILQTMGMPVVQGKKKKK